ncbi:MAG: SCO family protein [Bacteroidota bacterium]
MRQLIIALLFLSACGLSQRELPILGHQEIIDGETVYHQIPDFSFINQDSQRITNATFKDKIYISEFFFTSCPTICPKVKLQMLRVYERFAEEPRLMMLSHSIDVKYDTVERLKRYSNNLELNSDRWHLVTGEEEEIYDIADDYFSIAIEDSTVPGGFDHSGRLILVDENRHIRSFCNGVDPDAVDRFMNDITLLLDEKK